MQSSSENDNISRPNLDQLILNLKEGDTVMVWKLDRLARSVTGIFNLISQLTAKKVALKSITEKMIDTTNPNDHIANAMLGFFSIVAELERNLICERVREGVAIAKAQGKMQGRGRPKALGKLDVEELIKDAKNKGRTIVDLCKKYRISRKTYYRIMENNNNLQQKTEIITKD